MRFDDLSTATRADAEAVADAPQRRENGWAFRLLGGVDSAVLLALSVRVLGRDRALGLLADSPSLARHELQIARSGRRAAGRGRGRNSPLHEGDRPQYRANGADRCFYCKDGCFTVISETLAEDLRWTRSPTVRTADDAKRLDRPGAEAATRTGVASACQAGINQGSRAGPGARSGLSVADKPAAPCLASRIPHGEQVTPEKLRQVETAEQVLRDLGFSDFPRASSRQDRPNRSPAGRDRTVRRRPRP